MTASVHNATNATASQSGPENQNRSGSSEKVLDKAREAAQVAVAILDIAAQATQNVPYLGAISTALATFMEVLDEIAVCKAECRSTTEEAKALRDLIQKSETKWVHLESGEEDDLRTVFDELGRVVLQCLCTLQALKVDSRSRLDRLMLYFKRDEVQSSVARCRGQMAAAEKQFNTAVNLENNRILRELRQRSQLINNTQDAAPPAAEKPVWRLRAANAIFYGRESEVEAAVDLIASRRPARVAILGPGGIGKTSIALAILHDPKVDAIYGDWRCFMSCEATTTADAVVRVLADAIGVSIEKGVSSENSRHRLISHLKTISGIICLDNLETPLDADRNNLEEFLNEMSALPRVALLITSRDTSIPAMKWSSPSLPHIRPFSQDAALATWDDICHGHDEYALQLIEAVDCMPIAVNLLARLASVEGSAKSIWVRWQTERTDLIRTGRDEHRLFNVAASIELSLRSLSHSEEAVTVIGIICIFPSGLFDSEISMLHDALKDRLSVNRAVTLLKRLSLVYTELLHNEWTVIRMLSPIRHHIQQHHISDEIFLMLVDSMMQQEEQWEDSEWDEVLMLGFHRPGPCRERCVDWVVSDPKRTNDVEFLSQAISKAHTLGPQIESKLHRALGDAFNELSEFEKARSSFSQVIQLDEQLGDRQTQFGDWLRWIWNFNDEFIDREDECQHLDEVQNAIQKAWELGRDESGVWDRYFDGYYDLAWAQHFVNEGRRKRHIPVVHRSGLYSDNESTVELDFDDRRAAYSQLVLTSPPPWDLSSILETIETLHRAREEHLLPPSKGP
ncbi:hypothetical protein PENSPDRAFT_755582 [Peniophora sp. CONT]|nr:hypothetical protein PENSPDRAFT_755582 [Peniophora sp. CONT]